MDASAIFDQALNKHFAEKKDKFLRQVEGMFSKETEDSLFRKAEIVKQKMQSGLSFHQACDDPDVYIGAVDADYVHYILDNEKNRLAGCVTTPASLDKWRSSYLYGIAMREIR